MRGILMGFGAMPAARAVHSLIFSPRRLQEPISFLSGSKSSVHSPFISRNWTRMFGLRLRESPWLLTFLPPRYCQVRTSRYPWTRQLRPRAFQAAKKSSPGRATSKGRKLQETLQSSDVKYIEWWRVKVNCCHVLVNLPHTHSVNEFRRHCEV